MFCSNFRTGVKGMKKGHTLRMALLVGLLSLASCDGGADPKKLADSHGKTKPFDQLIADSNCMACHLPHNQMGVPSWEDVVKRYRDVDKNAAEAQLREKIAHGGSGAWGRMDMPPYQELSEAELEVIVHGLLERDGEKANRSVGAQKK